MKTYIGTLEDAERRLERVNARFTDLKQHHGYGDYRPNDERRLIFYMAGVLAVLAYPIFESTETLALRAQELLTQINDYRESLQL